MDTHSVLTDIQVAERFIEELGRSAAALVPGREWTAEDLQDVLEFVLRARPSSVRMLPGAELRRRMNEEIARADRYKTSFSVVVAQLDSEQPREVFDSILGALEERLRKSDLVFLYRRRFAIVLPHTGASVAEKLLARIRTLVEAVIGSRAELRMELQAYPAPDIQGGRAMLQWAEDRLREGEQQA